MKSLEPQDWFFIKVQLLNFGAENSLETPKVAHRRLKYYYFRSCHEIIFKKSKYLRFPTILLLCIKKVVVEPISAQDFTAVYCVKCLYEFF